MSLIQASCLLIALLSMTIIIKNVAFEPLLKDKPLQHRLFGASALLFVFWYMRVGIQTGLDVHFIWLTSLALVFGFRWACIAGSAVVLAMTAATQDPWSMLGVNILFGALLPIVVSYALFSACFHKLPKHVFVYIFLCAFFPGALAIASKMLAMSGYYLIDSAYTWDVIKNDYLSLIPLLAFPEAFFNGMFMTVLIIYKPEWVYTFHDKFYIDGK